jgi:NTE family protein
VSESYLPAGERSGVALCLSGGGYRAALFHLGALRRLNEIGALAQLETISAVSGGSILAAFLAQRVPDWPTEGAIADFDQRIAAPVRDFTRKNIRTLWVLRRLIRPWDSTVAVENLVRRYEKDIVQLKLGELPASPRQPRFIFSATDMAYGVNWVFEQHRLGSYAAGYVEPVPDWPVARAVAASSCFPPAFEPMPVGLDDPRFKDVRLTDGGVYDNMGLEPVWKDHAVVLVSDGGATFDFRPDAGPLGRIGRYAAIQGRQSAALRKRWLIAGFKQGALEGAYWGVGSVASHFAPDARGYRGKLVDDVISEVRTDLDYFSDGESSVLQNHGYLLADAAIRSHAPTFATSAPAAAAPFPDWLDEERVRSALVGSAKRKIPGRWRWRH